MARQSSDKKIPEDVCRKPHSPFCNDEVKISKAERRAAKKAAKEAKKKEKAAKKAAASKSEDEEANKISLVNFMEQLAISHGKPKGHYSSKRTMPQWKSLISDLKVKGEKQELWGVWFVDLIFFLLVEFFEIFDFLSILIHSICT